MVDLGKLKFKIMELRNISFPPALGASGVQGFFGNPNFPEYKHSQIIRMLFGDIFKNMGFVAKTATTYANKGNVELSSNDYSFKKLLPNAIYPFISKGAALNAVGLSNSGIDFLLETGIWHERQKPFMLSFMPVGGTPLKNVKETEKFCMVLKQHLPFFKTKIALQVNLSCPNTNHDQGMLLTEANTIFDILGELDIPLVPKINALLNPKIAWEIMLHPKCDALCVSNTIPFGTHSDILWKKFGMKNGKSPLEKYNYPPGGLSGAPIFPIVVKWIEEFCKLKSYKPIIAGGGVMSKQDVRILSDFSKVEAVSIGSVAFLRPWRVPGIIEECYKWFL